MEGIPVFKKECVERVDSEEIRKMSICCDLSLFKTKYQLENPYRVNSLLDELLSEEDKDCSKYITCSYYGRSTKGLIRRRRRKQFTK